MPYPLDHGSVQSPEVESNHPLEGCNLASFRLTTWTEISEANVTAFSLLRYLFPVDFRGCPHDNQS